MDILVQSQRSSHVIVLDNFSSYVRPEVSPSNVLKGMMPQFPDNWHTKNRGTPKWMAYIYIYMEKPYKNHGWFGGKNHYFQKHPDCAWPCMDYLPGNFHGKKMATGKRENGLVEDSHHMEHMGVVHGGWLWFIVVHSLWMSISYLFLNNGSKCWLVNDTCENNMVGLAGGVCKYICSKLHVMVDDPVTSQAPWSIQTWSLNRRNARQWYFHANKKTIWILNIYSYAVWNHTYITLQKTVLLIFLPSDFTYVPRPCVSCLPSIQPTTKKPSCHATDTTLGDGFMQQFFALTFWRMAGSSEDSRKLGGTWGPYK